MLALTNRPHLAACIFTTISSVRSPLFQRASSVETRRHNFTGSTTLHVAQQLPKDYFVGDPLPLVRDMVGASPLVMTMPAGESGCLGTCTTTVKVCHMELPHPMPRPEHSTKLIIIRLTLTPGCRLPRQLPLVKSQYGGKDGRAER